MSADADVRQAIIDSVFSRRTVDGATADNYTSHIKVYEEEGGGIKARYILLSIDWQGYGHIHKSRQNTNGTFSIGKSWKLEDLNSVEVVSPTSFRLSFARSYRWSTDHEHDQIAFLEAVIRLFRQVTNNTDLNVTGYQVTSHQIDGELDISIHGENTLIHKPVDVTPDRSMSPQGQGSARRQGVSSNTKNALPGSAAPSRSVEPRRGRDHTSKPSLDDETTSIDPALDFSSTGRPSIDHAQSTYFRAAKSDHRGKKTNVPSSVRREGRGEEQKSLPESDAIHTVNSGTMDMGGFGPDSLNRSINLSRPEADNKPQSTPSTDHVQYPEKKFGQVHDPTVSDSLRIDEELPDGTMADIEEILESIEWGLARYPIQGSRRGATSAADVIEERLAGELSALEKANIHSFLESDERVASVLSYIGAALSELDDMETQISSYKVHLNAAGEDIAHIQSQDRGLQVQIQNQMTLFNEIKQLLETLDVDRGALVALSQESLENAVSIQAIERAAAELYKALISGRETGVAATIERLEEYQIHNAQFCKRLLDFLSIAFKYQFGKALSVTVNNAETSDKASLSLPSHKSVERYFERYCGLMIYMKEMDEPKYSKVAGLYFSAANEVHSKEMKSLLASYLRKARTAPDDDGDPSNFSAPPPVTAMVRAGGTVKRAKTMVRSPNERKHYKRRDVEGELDGGKALKEILEQILLQMRREESFIADFFSVTDFALTFADWMQMEHYFRRKASALAISPRPSTLKLVQGGIDLIYGFLPDDLKTWTDSVLQRDPLSIIGILAAIEQVMAPTEEHRSGFIQRLLLKLQQRIHALFDRHVEAQVRAIEQTRHTVKKRNGVIHFIRYFPIYADRMESQLIGFSSPGARSSMDDAYHRILLAIFENLQHMAKMDVADLRDPDREDKGQLHYHLVLLENTYYFINETSHPEVAAISSFLKQAQGLFEDNLTAYVRLLIRRPMSKFMDYFEGLENSLNTTGSPNTSANPNYSRSAVKRILRDLDSKDIRRLVDALYKRVEKHFDDDSDIPVTKMKSGALIASIWQECEEVMVRQSNRFTKLLNDCYPGLGLGLEYSVEDIAEGFRRHRG